MNWPASTPTNKCEWCGSLMYPLEPDKSRLEPSVSAEAPRVCMEEVCYRRVMMYLVLGVHGMLTSQRTDETERLRNVVRRLLVGMKDARFHALAGSGEMVINAIEKAATECGVAVPE